VVTFDVNVTVVEVEVSRCETSDALVTGWVVTAVVAAVVVIETAGDDDGGDEAGGGSLVVEPAVIPSLCVVTWAVDVEEVQLGDTLVVDV